MGGLAMKPTTLFRAFREAAYERSYWYWRKRRGGTFGIAVDNDRIARMCQRRDRQVRALEARLESLLSQVEGRDD